MCIYFDFHSIIVYHAEDSVITQKSIMAKHVKTLIVTVSKRKLHNFPNTAF